MTQTSTTIKDYAYFQLSIKVLIKRGDDYLILRTPDNYIDFPGGRVNKDEIELSFIDCLKREVEEECGTRLKLSYGQLIFATKRYYTKNNINSHILALFYSAEYLSGEPTLSDEHSKFSWQPLDQIRSKQANFMSKDEYHKLFNYYDNLR